MANESPLTPGLWPLPQAAQAATEYLLDAWQRTILTWDVLRERGNQYLEHERSGKPPVLVFDYEMVVDGRSLAKPANYALVRIKPPAGYPAADPKKRPFVVIDPRAGHGPGIGGFKIDSEIGIALKQAHPCYFVMFFPQPEPGQTIESVCAAEVAFLRKVNELHPHAERPFVIGNCQGGWALMMLAALAPGEVGPILLAGSPVSYWAGVAGRNPMRYSGGLLGGTWMASMAGDLGHGKFDGAYLVNNFENLNPSNTYWTKLYNLYSKVDTERARFLEFEKWWGGHYLMNKEEMEWISQNLFVGNKLAVGEVESFDGKHRVDLRNIRSPIVVFASWGDNITPPQQALDWIPDLYTSVDDIRLNEQTIVYSLHERIGHLGIFVSGGVARKEHQEFASNIDLIDVLPPGLYEAVMTPKTADAVNPDLVGGDWIVRFEPRTLADLRAIVQPSAENELRFATARRVSEINLGLYRTLFQPFVQAFASPQTAEWLHQLNPSELPYELFSDRNPLMRQIAQLAEQIRQQRRPISPDNPLLQVQAMISDGIIAALDGYRDLRDRSMEQIFLAIYSAPLLQALMGLRASDEPPRRRPGLEPERLAFIQQRIAELKARLAEGGLPEAAIRSLVYIGMAGPGIDERAFEVLRQMRAAGQGEGMTLEEFKRTLREQFFALLLDRDAALAAIPKMLPADAAVRAEALGKIRQVASAAGEITGERAERLARIEKLFQAV